MRYHVAVRKTGEGYAVRCPGLPGCWSDGATEAEALANIREAIADYLAVAESLAAGGEAVVRTIDIPAGGRRCRMSA